MAPLAAGTATKCTTPPSTGSTGLLAVTAHGERVGERRADVRSLRRAAGDEREVEALALEGADVDSADPAQSALVSSGDACATGAGVDGRATGQKSHRLARAAVIAQGSEQRIAADQIIGACRFQFTKQVCSCIAGDDRVGKRGRAEVGEQAAEAGVAADGTVGQRERAPLVEITTVGQAATDASGVAADGAVGQRRRAVA